jgi:O-Antigen ligase.
MQNSLVFKLYVWIFFASISLLVIFPFVADYFILSLGVLGIVHGVFGRDSLLISPVAILLYLAAGLLLINLPVVFRGAADLIPFGAAVLVLVAPGVGVILVRGAKYVSPLRFHVSCLIAATVAVIAGGMEYLLTMNDRVGLGNNPIHYAALSVLVGILATPGVSATSSKFRFLFLLGPVFGLVAVLLSGSRGPFLAAMVLSLLVVMLLVLWYRRDRALMIALLSALCLAGAATVAFWVFMPSRAISILVTLQEVALSGSGAIDAYRQAMYGTAFSVMQTSPVFGIGFGQIMPHIIEANPDLIYMHTLQDLHSDFANFAAASGVPGFVAYLMLVLAPLPLLRRGHPGLDMTIILLSVGQFCLGLTNTTFGILPQTMLFVAALGYCIAARTSSRFSSGADKV